MLVHVGEKRETRNGDVIKEQCLDILVSCFTDKIIPLLTC